MLLFSNDDIKSALFDMGLWKSPGPDGFYASFYKKKYGILLGTRLLILRNSSMLLDSCLKILMKLY